MATATDEALKKGRQEEMSFWDHADALRGVLLRAAGVVVVLTALLFSVMPRLFDEVIMAPCRPDFWLYGLLGAGDFSVTIVNIKLASQFFIHVSSSFWLALVLSCPVIMYLLWTFVSPALYSHERRGVKTAFILGNFMFFAGLAVGYLLVFPITLRFLADYQVSAAVPNQKSLVPCTFVALLASRQARHSSPRAFQPLPASCHSRAACRGGLHYPYRRPVYACRGLSAGLSAWGVRGASGAVG